MKKRTIFLCLSVSVLLLPSLIMAQGVRALIDLPQESIAGQPVEVSIRINKGNLTGFARIQQSFPEAVSIAAVESAGADFSFSEGKVNIIWLNLPSKSELEIKYKLTTSQFVKGPLEVAGKFSYIIDNDRDEINLGPKTLLIQPAPNTDPAGIVDVYAFSGRAESSQQPGDVLDVAAFREVPYLSEASDGWIVSVLVSRGLVQKLARVEETIPEGFAAENVEGKGAIFSFKRGIAKFLWMKMPAEPFFLVSYKVIPTSGTSVQAPEIEGIFSYMMNDEVSTIPIIQEKFALHTMSENQLAGVIKTFMADDASGKTSITSVPSYQAPPQKKPETKVPQRTQPEPKPTKVVSKPLPRQDGIYFRVQLIATSKPLAAERHFAQYNLGEIYREEHQGLFKYTTGSFKEYKDARAFIKKLASETGIHEAFVTAYRDDGRIPVKEALRLTRQKWIK